MLPSCLSLGRGVAISLGPKVLTNDELIVPSNHAVEIRETRLHAADDA